MSIKTFFDLIRYKSYIKNLIIFLPLFLTYASWSINSFTKLLIIFVFFSILTSSVYILNDIFDIEIDKKHENKKNRPLAKGLFSIKSAIIIAVIFSTLSLFYFFYFTQKSIFLLTVIYLVINFFYSSFFKKFKYIDLIIVLSGFLIRIYIGSIVTEILLSKFLIAQVIFFVLFILICKRREYFFSFEKTVLSKYSLIELNFLSKLLLFLNIFNYLIYFFNDNLFTNNYTLFASFIIYSFLLIRYLIVNFKNEIFDPIAIYLNDKYLLVMSIIYIINILLGYYGA